MHWVGTILFTFLHLSLKTEECFVSFLIHKKYFSRKFYSSLIDLAFGWLLKETKLCIIKAPVFRILFTLNQLAMFLKLQCISQRGISHFTLKWMGLLFGVMCLSIYSYGWMLEVGRAWVHISWWSTPNHESFELFCPLIKVRHKIMKNLISLIENNFFITTHKKWSAYDSL